MVGKYLQNIGWLKTQIAEAGSHLGTRYLLHLCCSVASFKKLLLTILLCRRFQFAFRRGKDGARLQFVHKTFLLQYTSALDQNQSKGVHKLVCNGIADVRDLATRSMGFTDGRLVLRPTSRDIHKHFSFLFMDSSALPTVFLISGKMCDFDSFHAHCLEIF